MTSFASAIQLVAQTSWQPSASSRAPVSERNQRTIDVKKDQRRAG